MITQEFLSQCSDEQVNRGVAWLTVSDMCSLTGRLEYQKFMSISIMNNISRYCNDPGDIMPIAFANEISIRPMNDNNWPDIWGASENLALGAKAYNANPLRAICEVYILMSVKK